MQAVVNQSQLRSLNSLASRSFTTTDPLSLTSTRSVKLQPSIRSTDDIDTECAPETEASLCDVIWPIFENSVTLTVICRGTVYS